MKKILSLLGILFFVLFIITGCGKGSIVQNIDNSNYIDAKNITMAKVEKAITKGAIRKGWTTKKIKTGLLESKVNVRGKHFVMVNIAYNTKGYKIIYKDSQNMNYNPQDNTIHPNYNKWIGNLERNINYELSLIGVSGNSNSRNVTSIESSSNTTTINKSQYKSSGEINTNKNVIYIKAITPYAKNNRIAQNIKSECTINQQLAEFIQKYATEQGLTVKFKNNIGPNDLYLNLQIDDAISQGGAFRGHAKFTTISGILVKGKKSYGSFKAARVSGGGFWGAYKGSCAVLGRTVEALGKDVATWLYSPIDGAQLGDVGYLR